MRTLTKTDGSMNREIERVFSCCVVMAKQSVLSETSQAANDACFDLTGLHYNFRRYYDPQTGRYISEDPIGYESGVNPYLYVDHNPINYIDPTGECGAVGVAGGIAMNEALEAATGQCMEYGLLDFALDALCVGAVAKAFKLNKLRRGADDGGGAKRAKNKDPDPEVCDIGSNSFDGDTLVHTDEGLKPISEIAVGDQVLAYAEWLDEKRYEAVDAVITNEKDYTLYRISLNNGELIESTDGHPLFVEGQGWRDAKDLNKGDRLYLQDKGSVKITAIDVQHRFDRVFNLSVANAHTFFVGEEGVLVHNAKDKNPCSPKRATTPLGKSIQSLKEQLNSGKGPWKKIAAHAEKSTSKTKKLRGGVSVEEVYINNKTGQRLIRHIVSKDGKVPHQTFRPFTKFGRD